ncbi:MAG: hypothetical protein DRI57_11355 [Deltaproteobacteria bacterium]|nr:MAG: hypothetical protein DRI57_11355 [Deltaproteobacteria bacterium]
MLFIFPYSTICVSVRQNCRCKNKNLAKIEHNDFFTLAWRQAKKTLHLILALLYEGRHEIRGNRMTALTTDKKTGQSLDNISVIIYISEINHIRSNKSAWFAAMTPDMVFQSNDTE